MSSKRNLKGRPWTDMEATMLKAFWAEGMSLEMIASRLGRTPSAVDSACARYKLHRAVGKGRRRDWTPADDEALEKLWNENWSRAAIGAKLNPPRSDWAVERRAYALGFPTRFGTFKHLDGSTSVRYGSADKQRQLKPADIPAPSRAQDNEDLLQQLNKLATARFLIDFKRSGYTAAYYKDNCEMPAGIVATEPCLFHNEQPRPALADYRTWMGSPADLCAV